MRHQRPIPAIAFARFGFFLFTMFVATSAMGRAVQPDPSAAPLPDGVRAVWDGARAWRDTTATRERLCVNGLWCWQPADEGGGAATAPPAGGWGYFKVPGCWPGITDYLQKDSQTLFANPAWKDRNPAEFTAAWYQREIEVPAGWEGRRVTLTAEYLNSYAIVFVDGKKAGDMRFPAGEVDLTAAASPGRKHLLSLYVAALPLKDVLLSYRDTADAKSVKGAVPRRGLCGDVYLVSTPTGPRLDDPRVRTSVRREEVTVDVGLRDLAVGSRYALRAAVREQGKEIEAFSGETFRADAVVGGRFTFTAKWKPQRLWDLSTPQNTYELQVSLVDGGAGDRPDQSAKVIDTAWPVRFGFRELWIDGRDFYLNGTRLFLSAVPIDNATIGAGQANYAAARETLRRLKAIGVNFVYAHNYDCEPGSHLSFEEILRAADDAGVLVALTQPHFAQYDWKAPDADENNGYARHAAFYVKAAGSHPSVVFYSTSHNACGYDQDMNPDLLDGAHDARDPWSVNNAKIATRVESILNKLDPGRIVYHHAGGNIGVMHTCNFYPNFAPAQELSDWFAHWAEVGVKPAFLCEYGAPFTWDWTMYRGWYQGQREFGSAAVPWEFCLSEWDAQFQGDHAFAVTEREKANLRWEAKQFETGSAWHRWDYPTAVGSPNFEDRQAVLGRYLTDNWRAFRTWGVSGVSPWEYGEFWTAREGVRRDGRERKALKVDWDDLQRPGFSPDYIGERVGRMDADYEPGDWVPTAAGKAILRNNQPVLAYIGGKADAFTSKDHNFRAGETVEKQLIIINNARQRLTFDCDWSLALPASAGGPVTGRRVDVETGQQARLPLRFDLPAGLAPARYELAATVRYGQGETQSDTFALDVLPAPAPPPATPQGARIALFDPKGETAAWLQKQGGTFSALHKVEADADLSGTDLLVVGKLALSVDGPAPDLKKVRDGLKVVVFEQSSQALQRRLGFRVNEYGLRQVFERVPDHPILTGVDAQWLRDWGGEATTLPPRLAFENRPQHGPVVEWCGLSVSHVWRCGNRGDVASVLIEKPARGDFLPIIDGGFGLQYSPLMEYREGRGMALFCQLDVTGRTESDPAAETLAANALRYAAAWHPAPRRKAVYAGGPEAMQFLERVGVDAAAYDGGKLPTGAVLILGPGAAGVKHPAAAEVESLVQNGGRVLAIALDEADAGATLPVRAKIVQKEHTGSSFDPPAVRSPFAGVGPADAFSHAPREIPLVVDGATPLGDGSLALAPVGNADAGIVFCQIAPWTYDRGFDRPAAKGEYRQYNLKRIFRRSSFLLSRVLANLGVTEPTPLLEHFGSPAGPQEQRWLSGMYLDAPEEWDDPYRFFRW